MDRMKWIDLMQPVRQKSGASDHEDIRSAFERDYDRIIFSGAFRRLQDKTQVHPMPKYDFVHNRLTHSLEVSSVARSLGKKVGRTVIERAPDLTEAGFTYHDLGAVVAAAALAHDVGNPPFGHSGESGISDYFKSSALRDKLLQHLSENEWADLTNFEGNAQGFRILTQINGGLRLTYPVLAAFTKYPHGSLFDNADKTRKSHKKYGYFQSEATLFGEMAEQLQLLSYEGEKAVRMRHPLAFLVEAADDICYSIIDLEDGHQLGLVSYQQTEELLAAILKEGFQPEKLQKMNGDAERVGVLRALAINKLVDESADIFLAHESEILSGKFDTALTDIIDSNETLQEITKLSVSRIYRSHQVLQREAAGFEVLDGTMEAFTKAVFFSYHEPTQATSRHKNIIRLLPVEYQSALESSETLYQRLLVITDFVSGMTDSAALNFFQTIKGISLPGIK